MLVNVPGAPKSYSERIARTSPEAALCRERPDRGSFAASTGERVVREAFYVHDSKGRERQVAAEVAAALPGWMVRTVAETVWRPRERVLNEKILLLKEKFR